ncbi:G-type lectin S-receptor-like serine/threonine-protein kinase [Abeliophyllum distichum]|uniref:Receptor-like serine/threonine-protein kinase n=1 Tax=Abeliophyllum distichum TaxID=126358 RepID=A0ABD1QH16_9LAMI
MGILKLFIFFYMFITLALYTSIATDTFTPNQNFSDGQTLISSNRRFELGFFRLGNSGDSYLGIWYHNIPLTVVWVANRNNPITNSSGHLTMTSNGILLLYNSSMGIVWSTNETVMGKSRPVLQILGSGNLVVKSEEADGDDYVWQSFDNMTDTLLPGMKLGWKLSTGKNRFMRSWKSIEDPSDGDYTFSLDPPESPQLILRKGSKKEYRWGPFDGDRFSGSNELRTNAVFRPMFVANSDEVYFAFQLLDESTLSRFVVTQSGLAQYLTWRNHSREWSLMVILNRFYCDRYGMCGPYGNCYADDPNCRCLKGFIPRLPQDWKVADWEGGCRRKYDLNCSVKDGFVKYNKLKLPDNAVVWANVSLEECKTECLKECDCVAYTLANLHGNGSKCLVWLTDLIDLRDFPKGGEELNIRMARAELDSIAASKRKKLVIVVVVIIISTLSVILILTGVWWYVYRAKRKIGSAKTTQQDQNSYLNSQEENQEEDLELPLFDIATIVAATNNFSFNNKIGQGGFGPVYKGELPNGIEIAVKRLSKDSGQGLREFKNEVVLIAKLQHRNLVRLLGCCIQAEERMLIYEYLPNRSLDSFVFDPIKRELLTWSKRFGIILGIARGLLYLHQDSRLRIIHRDLKTSNILLDGKMNPKISDFGIARIFGGEQTEEKTRRIIGTYGYMSPEYAMSGHFSVKSDVFSYGVIVLEIISGKKNWGFNHPDHDYNLLGHAWKLWNEGSYLELIDTKLDESLSINEVERCIQVGLLCVQQRAEDRPTMSSVVLMLSTGNAELPQPKEPGFAETSVKIDSSSSHPSCYTGNEITITNIEGR